MLSSVWKTIRREQLFAAGDRVVVAVSGGPDSMALLAVLWELAPRLLLRLEVANVDHGLRPEAAAEAALVAERASALELPFHRLAVDVLGARAGGRPRGSLQSVARTLRLQALEDLAGRLGGARVALGHHADDQAETILFRILRGTGVRGLRGIPYQRGVFIRPLLDVRRTAIEAYIKRRCLPVVHDPSNMDSRFTRARLRHQLLPLLRQENPRVIEALLALGADARLAPIASVDPIGHVGRAATAIAELRGRGGTAVVDVAGGQIMVAYGETTRLPGAAILQSAPHHLHPVRPVSIRKPGMYWLAGSIGVEIKERSSADPAVSDAFSAFDADAVPAPLLLRPRLPGDRMRPRGGRGSRKLSDLLIDAKIARPARAELPVLAAADGTVLFVPGLRPSEVGRPTEHTRRLVHVRGLSRQERSSV
ncbi:MAG TPA: tRNA lysidine(34) synthetase TilS [Polyangia bacterium]|jgi:tRNA(Ile)-lysidine synthase|nr:tRNA lysidine(34) synthetase TilS [Polyangia bacterium]